MPAAPPSEAQCQVRAEVLRCLLVCLSGSLFQTGDEFAANPSPWPLHFTSGEVCHSANLFCSLMSTVLVYDPVGWGVPYGGYFSGSVQEDLVDTAMQVLCVILDFS